MTIHKAQGMTVGEGMDFEKLIVYLTVAGQRSAPGLELVAFSRVKKPEDITVGNLVGELEIRKHHKYWQYTSIQNT